jgi:hypothetical protein
LNGILLLYFAVVLLCDKLLLGLRIEMTWRGAWGDVAEWIPHKQCKQFLIKESYPILIVLCISIAVSNQISIISFQRCKLVVIAIF